MDPMMLIPWIAAVIFMLTSIWLWRRAIDAEERIAELEAQLKKGLPRPEPAPEEAEPAPAQEEEEEGEEEEEDEEDEDEEEEAAAAPAAKQEPAPTSEPPKAKSEPPAAAPKSEPPKAKSEPPKAKSEPPKSEPPKPASEPAVAAVPAEDPLRKEAIKVVRDALELARYLDFDAIVEPPTVYRVTVPITSANGKALRYLTDDMFPALKKVTIEGSNAILHVDIGKPAP